MGIFNNFFGLGKVVDQVGRAVTSTAEVFKVNQTERMHADAARFQSSIGQYGAEFTTVPVGRFAGFVAALNRLPRPLMALGTIGLFVFAMASPESFTVRMQGLAFIPEPLWWLLGAVVSFYFGARELHHFRTQKMIIPTSTRKRSAVNSSDMDAPATDNPAIDEWNGMH